MKSNCVWSDAVRTGLERANGLTEIKGTVTLDKDKNVVKLCGRARDILGSEICDKIKGESFEKYLLDAAVIKVGRRQHVEFERDDHRIVGRTRYRNRRIKTRF